MPSERRGVLGVRGTAREVVMSPSPCEGGCSVGGASSSQIPASSPSAGWPASLCCSQACLLLGSWGLAFHTRQRGWACRAVPGFCRLLQDQRPGDSGGAHALRCCSPLLLELGGLVLNCHWKCRAPHLCWLVVFSVQVMSDSLLPLRAAAHQASLSTGEDRFFLQD